MKVIDMRVRIPREASKEEPADFMKYYQERAGFASAWKHAGTR
jgi:hypothetical protein